MSKADSRGGTLDFIGLAVSVIPELHYWQCILKE